MHRLARTSARCPRPRASPPRTPRRPASCCRETSRSTSACGLGRRSRIRPAPAAAGHQPVKRGYQLALGQVSRGAEDDDGARPGRTLHAGALTGHAGRPEPSAPIWRQARSVSATLHACAMAPRGRKRRVTLENLGDAAEAVVAQVMRHGQQVRARGLPVPIHPQVGEGEWAKEPSPCRALVIRAVALAPIRPVAARVRGIAGCEAPQPERGQELARAGVDHPSLPLRRSGLAGSETARIWLGRRVGSAPAGPSITSWTRRPPRSRSGRSPPRRARPSDPRSHRVGPPPARESSWRGAHCTRGH